MGEGFDTETGIKYVSFGSGKKTMAVVPGLSVGFVTDAKESLENVFEAFKDEYTVFVFDVRKDVPENFTMEAMGEDLAEVIMRLGLNDVYMYGCSMGGIEAMYVAGKYPQLVKKLAVASSACRSNKTIQKTLKKWLKMAKTGKYRALTDNFGKKIYSKPVYEAGKEALMALADSMTEELAVRFIRSAAALETSDVSKTASNIRCPVLALGSKGDKVMTPRASKEIAKLTRGELFLYGKEFPHAVYDEASDFRDRVKRFFDKID